MLALKGATETLRTIDVIVTETSNVEYNKGAPETLEILNFMDRLGFKIFDITETHRKPLRSGEDSHAGGSGVLVNPTRVLADMIVWRSLRDRMCQRLSRGIDYPGPAVRM